MSDPFDPGPEEDAGREDAEGDDAESYYGMERIGIDSPEASIPDASVDFENADTDPQVRTLFWKVVIALKATLLTLTVGAMLVVSGENPALGRRVLVLAAVLAGYTVYQYRKSKRRLESGEFDAPDEGGPAGEESPGDSAAEDADGVGEAPSGSGRPDGVAADGSDESPGEPDVEGT